MGFIMEFITPILETYIIQPQTTPRSDLPLLCWILQTFWTPRINGRIRSYSLGILLRLNTLHALSGLCDRLDSLRMNSLYRTNVLRRHHHSHFVGCNLNLAAHEYKVANLCLFLNNHLNSITIPNFYITEQFSAVFVTSWYFLFIISIKLTDISNFLHHAVVFFLQLLGLVPKLLCLHIHVDNGMYKIKELSSHTIQGYP